MQTAGFVQAAIKLLFLEFLTAQTQESRSRERAHESLVFAYWLILSVGIRISYIRVHIYGPGFPREGTLAHVGVVVRVACAAASAPVSRAIQPSLLVVPPFFTTSRRKNDPESRPAILSFSKCEKCSQIFQFFWTSFGNFHLCLMAAPCAGSTFCGIRR